MSPRNAARRDPAERRGELLEAALDAATADGLAALSPTVVAARAGRSKALVFHYFGSTDGLRRAVALHVVHELDARLRAPEGLDYRARRAHLAAAFLDAVVVRRAVWRDIWRGELADDVETGTVLDEIRSTLVDRMVRSTHGAQARGGDAERAAAAGRAERDATSRATARSRALARGWVALVESIAADWLDGAAGTGPRPVAANPTGGRRRCSTAPTSRRSSSPASTGSGSHPPRPLGRPVRASGDYRRTRRSEMRVVVVGASGNVGTAVLAALAREPVVTSLVGVARRVPRPSGASTVEFPHDAATWERIDLAGPSAGQVRGRLVAAFSGADTVIHLARTPRTRSSVGERRATDVEIARRVFDAAGAAGVAHVVAGSCTGAYAASGGDEPRVESWPVRGGDATASAPWARADTPAGRSAAAERPMTSTAEVERHLVRLSQEHEVVVTSVRSPIVLHRRGASQLVRDVVGKLPSRPLRKDGTVPLVLWPEGLRVQVVHADDLADAFHRIVVQRQPGAFNVAAPDVLDGQDFADLVSAGELREISPSAARRSLAVASRIGLAPVDPIWLATLFDSPVLDTTLARTILHWTPRHDARSTLAETVRGIRDGAGSQTPPLLPL
ncbi:hypothetical protein GCM10025865_18770 [Paraoerskovia sediminicola]|uniref:HTH tetR-type domain-containing protein n=1 Tax=Paraoerskovia sediminicola TaxID=1138587 RepID=A0ABM8G369_9CELL|nr:NAD-dependent epimerase/dehydratase family protein [Paraoerskovia sediminicola]BDZ42578.1 hypothetical protein GCM10025865_18770 [Paraoerskovia sediminicola]